MNKNKHSNKKIERKNMLTRIKAMKINARFKHLLHTHQCNITETSKSSGTHMSLKTRKHFDYHTIINIDDEKNYKYPNTHKTPRCSHTHMNTHNHKQTITHTQRHTQSYTETHTQTYTHTQTQERKYITYKKLISTSTHKHVNTNT